MNYYEIVDLTGARTGIFRHSMGTVERWNPAARSWDQDSALFAYVYNGEAGAEPITEEQAMTITGESRAPPPEPPPENLTAPART